MAVALVRPDDERAFYEALARLIAPAIARALAEWEANAEKD